MDGIAQAMVVIERSDLVCVNALDCQITSHITLVWQTFSAVPSTKLFRLESWGGGGLGE